VEMAASDLVRTLDFLQYRKVPVLGAVSNMDGCVLLCGTEVWPLTSPRSDLPGMCTKPGMTPYGGEVDLVLGCRAEAAE